MPEKIPLPKFLKMLTSGNVPVARAMNVSSKMSAYYLPNTWNSALTLSPLARYKQCNTAEQLSELDDFKLKGYGVEEKDVRKLVLTAVKKAGYGTTSAKRNRVELGEPGPSTATNSVIPPSTVDVLTTPNKRKRKRNEEVNEFLPSAPDEAAGYGSLDFNEVLDEEVLRTKSVVINRAPLMTIWATVVAERMGFKREEALSIASVYTEMNAISKGVTLGIFEEGKEKGLDASRGGTQPYVDFIGRRPLYQTQEEDWRALLKGTPAKPSAAYGYISRSFRQTTPYITGSLRLLANSFTSQEINDKAWSLYIRFRPEVNEWGKRSQVKCLDILTLRKPAGGTTETKDAGGQATEGITQNIKYEEAIDDAEALTPDKKRTKTSTPLENYEQSLADDRLLNDAISAADF
ncbi:hypothetical protein V5O48_005068 [Marasmius crinis-equi]|uniref:Capsid protein n=1 Tax=Marasmius crinis-equi TaxID=585013 RepID=A0ABR3FND7_9AGAR